LKKKIIGFAALLALSILLSAPLVLGVVVETPPQAHGPPVHVNDGTTGYIFVTSQELYYKTIVPYAGGNLVYNGHNGGSFQELYAGMTDYGPGDPGYRGGRWWIDNGPNGHADNGVMDPDDTYFLCPLQGPGIETLPT
jgi:hypothetical protein